MTETDKTLMHTDKFEKAAQSALNPGVSLESLGAVFSWKNSPEFYRREFEKLRTRRHQLIQLGIDVAGIFPFIAFEGLIEDYEEAIASLAAKAMPSGVESLDIEWRRLVVVKLKGRIVHVFTLEEDFLVFASQRIGAAYTDSRSAAARLPQCGQFEVTFVVVPVERETIAETSRPEAEGFISVNDRLPTCRDGESRPTKVYVEVLTNGGKIKRCGMFYSNGKWDDEDYAPGMRVTHWRPLKPGASK